VAAKLSRVHLARVVAYGLCGPPVLSNGEKGRQPGERSITLDEQVLSFDVTRDDDSIRRRGVEVLQTSVQRSEFVFTDVSQ
jgi:hypothetical protein